MDRWILPAAIVGAAWWYARRKTAAPVAVGANAPALADAHGATLAPGARGGLYGRGGLNPAGLAGSSSSSSSSSSPGIGGALVALGTAIVSGLRGDSPTGGAAGGNAPEGSDLLE